jgi:hypothetical protein
MIQKGIPGIPWVNVRSLHSLWALETDPSAFQVAGFLLEIGYESERSGPIIWRLWRVEPYSKNQVSRFG